MTTPTDKLLPDGPATQPANPLAIEHTVPKSEPNLKSSHIYPATQPAKVPEDAKHSRLLFAARLGLGFVENPSCIAIDLPTEDGRSRWNRESAADLINAALNEQPAGEAKADDCRRFVDQLIAGLRFIGIDVAFPEHCPDEMRITNGVRHTQMRLPCKI